MCVSRPADKMKACSLHVVYGFTEQGEWGCMWVGRMEDVMLKITTAKQRSCPISLGLMLCLWESLCLFLHDSNSLLPSPPSAAEIH